MREPVDGRGRAHHDFELAAPRIANRGLGLTGKQSGDEPSRDLAGAAHRLAWARAPRAGAPRPEAAGRTTLHRYSPPAPPPRGLAASENRRTLPPAASATSRLPSRAKASDRGPSSPSSEASRRPATSNTHRLPDASSAT